MERRSIQRFELLAVLGDGGMGTVYRARDPQLEREVAIKVLNASSHVRAELSTHNTVDLRGRRRTKRRDDLLHEARLMARVAHPNVVPIFEVGLDDRGDVFVVMEYVAGEDLRQWLAVERSVAEIMRVFAHAARGLEAAHAHGIVHRDFKPDNVLIGADGRARVTDFGISKLAEPMGLVVTGKIAGTPRYMAPELWNGDPATTASDVFALCTAFRDAIGDRANEAVAALAWRGVAKDPRERPAIGEIITALEGEPPRRRIRVGLVAAIAVAAIGTSVAFAVGTDEEGCEVDPGLLAGRWDATKRAALRASLPSDADRLIEIFDRRAAEIVRLHGEACEAKRANRLTAEQAQQQAACLELRAIELGAVADVQIAAKSDAGTAEIRFNRTSLPVSCSAIAVTTRDPRALEDLYARFVKSGEMPAEQALVELAAIETAARSAGDPELAVKAAVNLGTRQRNTDQLQASDETLQRAYTEAVAIGSSEAATNAIAERIVTLDNSKDVLQTKTLGALAIDLADKPTTTPRARLRLLRAIGISAQARGETRASIDILRKALAESKQDNERDPDIEALLRIHIAESMLIQGDGIPEAIELAKEAVALTRVQGEHTNNHGLALNMLSKAYMLHNDLDQALDYRRRAIAVFTSIFPATHSAVLEARVDLGVALMRASQFEAAHRELAEAVGLVRETGAMPRAYPWMLSRLASATAELGRTDEAIRLFEQAVELLASTVGNDHPQTVNQRFNLAALLFEQGRLDDAERVVRVIEHSGKRSALVHGWLAPDLARARGHAKEAEALARGAIDELTEVGADEELAIARRRLGEALVDQGRFAEARDVLELALASARAQNVRADDLAGYELALAAAELGLGKREDARARAERAKHVLEHYPAAKRARADAARLAR